MVMLLTFNAPPAAENDDAAALMAAGSDLARAGSTVICTAAGPSWGEGKP